MRALPAILALVLTSSALAGSPQAPLDDPFRQFLFPPELIMTHRTELGLDEEQGLAVKQAVRQAQTRFFDLQWDLRGESEKLAGLLGAVRVDEQAALAQAEKVMNLEREIKKTHISLLIRIKNLLSQEQQIRLMEIRRRLLPPAPPAPADPPVRPDPAARPTGAVPAPAPVPRPEAAVAPAPAEAAAPVPVPAAAPVPVPAAPAAPAPVGQPAPVRP